MTRPDAHDRTVPDLLAAAVAADPARPLITWYDHADGARIELSTVTTANWVAKTAGLLRDVLGAGPGARIAIDLPAHWQTWVWVVSAWTAGAVVVPLDHPDLDVAVVGPAGLDDLPDAAEVAATALHPLGARFSTGLPVGVTDIGAEVLAMPDAYAPSAVVRPGDDALADAAGTLTHAELAALGAGRADTLGLRAGGRLLATASAAVRDGALSTVLAPLVSDGSLVLVSNPELAALADLAAEERVDVTAS